ncbi:hypothetical protein KUTeg_002037 [Tegillarca granosa]|uniref:Agrin n=1 Tax=Tegillarca granosa TaxID=220873 RepID=A0ABQ9FT92_TEGGR|nr:hypothetical protein KUTeg_002037 [Tegillarca granosa]
MELQHHQTQIKEDAQNIAKCRCHHLGSTRNDCEQMEGNCNCKPGVIGRKCDTCLDGTYIDETGCNGILSEGKSCREIVCAFYGVCIESNGYASCSCNLPCVMQNNQNSISVCGSDGNTYPNECRLKVDSCSRRVNITVAYPGICYGGTSAHPATSMPLTDRSRKTTRHINSGRIWGLCFGNNYCNVPNSECRTGVCRCKKGFIPTLENTHCSEVITEEVPPQNIPDDFNPCTANPCKHNGTCELDDSLGYRCLCTLGWMGPICRETVSYMIPSFSGKSYLALAEVLKPDNDITIEIGFQTYSHDGILFYSSQYRNGSGDFMSITLKNGHLEFRYDLGSGIAVLNSQDVLNLNQPYKIIVNRMGREGMLEIKGGGVVKGSSPPSLTSLNLKGPMYLGYIPDYVEVATDRMEVYLGFVGCITSFKAGTTDSEHDYNLAFQQSVVSSDILGGQDIGVCGNNPCRSLPCQNGGSCQMLYTDSFHCTCSAGFSGKLCDEAMHPCVDSPCKDGASCQLTKTGGYKCVCPDDREGEFCEYERLQKVFIPEFLGTSMIQLPLDDASITSLSIKIWFKTYQPNGVLFYSSQFANGLGDFISLNIVENSLEYRFDVGAGTVIIRSNRDIQIDHWHEVMIQKIGTYGTLLVDNDDNKRYTGESEGILTELNLQYGFLYLGGFKNRFTIPRDSDITTNFTGVIQRIYINNKHIDNIMESKTDAHNIIEYIGPPCNVNPCLNGGVCYPRLNEVDCKCPKKFLGQMCEKRADGLIKDAPILFDGTTHLQYANEITTEQNSQRTNRYNIKFRTSQHSGLILYQNGRTNLLGDYLALAIVNGKVEFSYNLGKQTEDDLHIIRSAVKVDDGQWHRLVAYREEREGSLQVDSETPVVDTSNAGATQLDTNGELWIGGKVDLPLGLPFDYRQGFTGCISEVYINDRQLHLLDQRNQHSTHIMRFCK